jgi:hypothetical protein
MPRWRTPRRNDARDTLQRLKRREVHQVGWVETLGGHFPKTFGGEGEGTNSSVTFFKSVV